MNDQEKEKEPIIEDETYSREKLDWRGAVFAQLLNVVRMPTNIPAEQDPRHWARAYEWSVNSFLVLISPFKDATYEADLKRLEAWFEKELQASTKDVDYDLTKSLVQYSRDKLEASVMLLDRRGFLVKKGTTETLLEEDELEGDLNGQ